MEDSEKQIKEAKELLASLEEKKKQQSTLFIKGFDKDLKCRNYQFEVGKVYDTGATGKLALCTDTVFHFCRNIQQVHEYYSCDRDNRYCYIRVLGDLVEDDDKCGSNKIEIVREIVAEELAFLLGKINGNAGLFNSGDCNSGDHNSGYCNSGDHNSGDYNSGDRNSGYHNSGDCNSGSCNSGDCNSGNYNSGDRNSGSYNSGDRNSGDHNIGIFNKCDHSTGAFTTKEMPIIIFNKQTNLLWRDFKKTQFYQAIMTAPFRLTEWVNYTNEEKAQDKEKELIVGYLKTYTYEEACANWWNAMSEESKKIIMDFKYFDAEVFKEITGIDVRKERL